jgi:hypothetical protein
MVKLGTEDIWLNGRGMCYKVWFLITRKLLACTKKRCKRGLALAQGGKSGAV